MSRRLSPRGFTLIEIVISLSISLAILALATGIVVTSMREAKRSRVRAELARDAQLVDRLLRTELPAIGLGVPTAGHIAAAYGTNGQSTFYASLLVASPTEIGFLTDVPRPDAQLTPFGILPSRPLGGRDRIHWLNDTTGSCLPDSGGGSCSMTDTSRLLPGDTSNCATSATDRLCPWSMKRLAPNEPFQVVAGDGTWTHALMPANPSLTPSSPPAPPAGFPAMAPVRALDLADPWDASWQNNQPGDRPAGVRGQGYVTTIDRVFYVQNGTTIRRVQCWGDPDPMRNDWPGPTATTVPPLSALRYGATPGGTTQPQTCTEADVVARNVKSASFRYFDILDNEIVSADTAVEKASIRRIDYEIVLERDHDGRPLQEQLTGSVAIRNP